MKQEIVDFFRQLQSEICSGLEELDGKSKFSSDNWERDGGGGGLSRVIQDGDLIEKGGVNFSEVYGTLPDNIVAAAAHEMGTPLATIKLVASELREELADHPDLQEDAALIG